MPSKANMFDGVYVQSCVLELVRRTLPSVVSQGTKYSRDRSWPSLRVRLHPSSRPEFQRTESTSNRLQPYEIMRRIVNRDREKIPAARTPVPCGPACTNGGSAGVFALATLRVCMFQRPVPRLLTSAHQRGARRRATVAGISD